MGKDCSFNFNFSTFWYSLESMDCKPKMTPYSSTVEKKTTQIDSSEMSKTIIKLSAWLCGRPTEICLFRNLFITANYYTKLIIIAICSMFIQMYAVRTMYIFPRLPTIVPANNYSDLCVRHFDERGHGSVLHCVFFSHSQYTPVHTKYYRKNCTK